MPSRTLPSLYCKHCRKEIAQDIQLQEHEIGPGQKAFSYRKRAQSNTQIDTCQTWFIQEWETCEIQGKLNCPHCEAKLGFYDLSGAQCSCGTWVSPAFCVAKSKVDAKFT